MRLERDLTALGRSYDVVVVGGGITGVCVAREAAGRGLRTLLVEKDDLGAGTSSATTKYLHGGIRYLEQYEFGVVRESLRERRVLSLAAPHLVQPVRFLMPAWRWSKPSAPLLAAGVLAYDLLAWDKNWNVPPSLRMRKPRWVPKRRLLQAVPWLQPTALQGAFAYPDVLNVHPERLLLALALSAVQHGAALLTHVRADRFLLRPAEGGGSEVHGVAVVDQLTGERHEVQARTVVNAGGPWMDVVLRGVGRDLGVGVQRSKGVHLLTRPLGGTDAVFARAPSGRHVIVSPWEGHSFIGPTDTAIDDEPDDVRAVADDVDLILDTVNATSTTPLTRHDVRHVTVGIRPLVKQAGGSYSTSRRHELYDHGTAGVANLWSIAGGKWTTGRALGEHMLDTLVASPALAGAVTRPFSSRRAPVSGAFAWASDAEPYLQGALRLRPDLPVSPAVRLHLARLYGTAHTEVLDLVDNDARLARPVSTRPGRLDIAAQVVYAVTHEAACTVADAVDRRLVLGTLGGVTPDEVATVAALMAPLLGWDEARTAAEERRYLDRVERVAALL